MKATHLFIVAAFSAAASISLYARSYIAERGDTWESIARKWGVHTEELKAANPFFSEIYMGVEVDLPENSAADPLSNHTIAQYATDDINIENAEKALADAQYSSARSLLSSSMHRQGHSTARLHFLYASACAGSSDYINALENYSEAATLFNAGDRTMTREQTMAINAEMERLVPLAQEQKEKEEELRRFREELAEKKRQKDEEKRQRRREFWGNLGTALLQGLNVGMQAYSASQGWAAAPTTSYVPAYTPVYTPTYTPVVMPQVTPPNWDFSNNFFTPDFNSIQWNDWNNGNNFQNIIVPANWSTMPVNLDSSAGTSGLDNSGGFSGAGSTSGTGTNPVGEAQYETYDCPLCNGTGWMVNNSNPTFGQTGTRYCNICNKTVDLSHGHERCPSCKNGKQRRRIR